MWQDGRQEITMSLRRYASLALLIAAIAGVPTAARQRPTAPPPQTATAPDQTPLEQIVNALPMRNIGAFRTGAWVTAIDVPTAPAHDHLYTIYAASRSGGLWKTVNGGITWDNITDSIG